MVQLSSTMSMVFFLCPFFSYPFPIFQLRQQLPQIGAHLLLCVCILWHIFHAHLNQILHIAIQIYTIGVAPFAVILIQKAICFPADAVIRKRHAAALANQLSRRAKQCVDGHIEQLAAVMERYGIEWEQKGTHEKHLSVLDYKKQQRTEKIERLESKITDKQTEFETLSKRIKNFDKGTTALSQMQNALENAPEYQLSEPQGFMTAKSYKSKVAEPLIKRLKSLIKTLMVRCFQAIDDYQRLNQTNASLYRSNERLKSQNKQLTADNNRLREEIKDYKLLRKVFGSRQIDSLLEQARHSKQRGTRFRNKENER